MSFRKGSGLFRSLVLNDADQKRQLIDTIYYNMIELAQAGRQV